MPRPLPVLAAVLTLGALAAPGRASAPAGGGHATDPRGAGGPPGTRLGTAHARPNVTSGQAAGLTRARARGADAPHAPGAGAPATHKDRFPDPGSHPTVESVRDGRWTD